MLEGFGQRQQELLKLLNKHKGGRTIDEIAEATQITRTAVRQHLAAFEAEGLIKQGTLRVTAGRPSRLYVLTERGMELFPRQYSWFSELMLDVLRREQGGEALAEWLRQLAGSVSRGFEGELAGLSTEKRVERIVEVMNSLAYDAEARGTGQDAGPLAVEASNCVFHHLAAKFPEVCQFDLALISRMAGTEMQQSACMAKGDHVCRFIAQEA